MAASGSARPGGSLSLVELGSKAKPGRYAVKVELEVGGRSVTRTVPVTVTR